MAAVLTSYPPNVYQTALFSHSALPFIYNLSSIPKSPKIKKSTTVTKESPSTEKLEKKSSSMIRVRREPRIRRQVIVLPTPEPIYRQVRHRLPTPERAVIQRTIIQKSNGDIIVQQERQKSKPVAESQSKANESQRSRKSKTT